MTSPKLTFLRYVNFVLTFLEKKHIYSQFVTNLESLRASKEDISLIPFLRHMYKITSSDQTIDWAFTWDMTPEGHEFWASIHKSFKHEYNSFKEKLKLHGKK